MILRRKGQTVQTAAQALYRAGGIAVAAVYPAGEAVVYSKGGHWGIAGETGAYIRMIDLADFSPHYHGPETFEKFTIVSST